MTLIGTNTVNPNGFYYDQLEAWFAMCIVQPMETIYHLPAVLIRTRAGLPFVDLSTTLSYVDNFYLVIGSYTYPLDYQEYVMFRGVADSWISIILAEYSRVTGLPIPQPSVPVPVVVVVPPAQADPVGALINDGTNTKYINLAGTTYSIGSDYTDPATGQKYQLYGYITPWGPQVWWQRAV